MAALLGRQAGLGAAVTRLGLGGSGSWHGAGAGRRGGSFSAGLAGLHGLGKEQAAAAA